MTTLRRRLVASHVGLAGVLMVVGALYVGAVSSAERNRGIRSGAARDATVLAERVRDASIEPSALRATLTQEVSARRQAEVVDDSGTIVAVEQRAGSGPSPMSAPQTVIARALDGESGSALWGHGRAVFAAAPIVRNETIVGAAVVVEDAVTSGVWSGPIAVELAVGALLMLLAAAIASALAEGVAGPIRAITGEAHRLALGQSATGDGPGGRTPQVQELATLRAAFQRVRERTLALQDRTRHAEAAQGSALRRVSHQLRTPLSVIALRLDDVVDGRRDDRRRAAEIIDAQLGRLAALSDELTRQARSPDAGPPMEVVDVAAATRTAAAALMPLAQWSGVHFHVETPERAPAVAPASMLDDAIANVIENAIKFTPRAGAIHVRVRAESGAVVVEVEDDGPGIDPGERERVRRPWVRGSASASTPGSGVGLSLVDEAMSVAGGSLELLDAPTGGLLVRMRIPVGRARRVVRSRRALASGSEPRSRAPRSTPTSA